MHCAAPEVLPLALTLPLHSCLPPSRSIPLFSALAGGLFVISGLMLALYLPAATHLKKLRMGTAGEAAGPHPTWPAGWAALQARSTHPTPPLCLLTTLALPPPVQVTW